jgi:hypothetical protein
MNEQRSYSGSCLCGSVRYRLRGPLAPIQVCHCVRCRKAQGGPFATNIPVALADFELLSGAAQLRAYESSPGKFRHFCGLCGAPVYSRRLALPGMLRVRAGLLDGDLAAAPASQAHVRERANWWPALPGLPEAPLPPPPTA